MADGTSSVAIVAILAVVIVLIFGAVYALKDNVFRQTTIVKSDPIKEFHNTTIIKENTKEVIREDENDINIINNDYDNDNISVFINSS